MGNSLPRRKPGDDPVSTLAPVIFIQSSPVKSRRQGKKVLRVMGKEEKPPMFYTKPIFKSKKYDLF
jgi:hypothetical protein